MLTSSIGGPRKAYTNRCTNSSPRYSVRTTMLSSFVCLGNFLGFRLNDKHNASKNSNMFWREFCSIRCKSMKNNQINSVKAILIFSFLVFYNLNPLLGVSSSFWVWLTPSFSLSSLNFILNHSSIGIPSIHSWNLPFSCGFLSTVAVECSVLNFSLCSFE